MPSTSKSQQRLMGVAYAVKSGDMQLSDVDSTYRDKVKELVDGMSLKDLKDFASTPHEGLPEVVETVAPESIGGMGDVQLPTETEFGSGDVPAGPGDAKKRNKKKMKFKQPLQTYEAFLKLRSEGAKFLNEGKFKAGDKWEWKHVDGNKTVEITDIKPNGDVIARVDGDSQEFILREPNKYLKKKVNESTEINEANWGTYDTPEGKMVSKELDKAWTTFAKTVDSAHKEWLKVVNKYRGDAGKGSGFIDSEGRDSVISAMEWFIEKVFMADRRFGGIDYKKYRTLLGESAEVEVNEARSINKIQKDYTAVTSKMKEVVDAWKAAEGATKDKLLSELKDLTTKKKALERELDEFVMGKDADLELVVKESLSESMMAEIDIIAQEAKDFKDFAKKVTKEFKLEDDKDLFAWLKSLYDNRS